MINYVCKEVTVKSILDWTWVMFGRQMMHLHLEISTSVVIFIRVGQNKDAIKQRANWRIETMRCEMRKADDISLTKAKKKCCKIEILQWY